MFSLICSTKLVNAKELYPKIETIDHGYWKQIRICLPPFNWAIPNGIKENQLSQFWIQPENMRHFLDTNVSDHCGVVRVVHNGSVKLPLPSYENVTHYINDKGPPQQTDSPNYKTMVILTGHWGYFFQHFFDNIGTHFGLFTFAFPDINFNEVTAVVELSSRYPNVPKLWDRFGFKEVLSAKRTYTAETLIYIEICPRVHPMFFDKLREHLKLELSTPEVIIFLCRKPSNSYYHQRFIQNQEDVISTLKSLYGENLVIYDHSQHTLEETIKLFGKAKAIIGVHGGAFYNQFFSPKDTTIVEIMPIKSDGLYPDQLYKEKVPSFAHMAMWSNSILIGQKFWRFYQIANSMSFSVDIDNFKQFLIDIPELNDFLTQQYRKVQIETKGDTDGYDIENLNDDMEIESLQIGFEAENPTHGYDIENTKMNENESEKQNLKTLKGNVLVLICMFSSAILVLYIEFLKSRNHNLFRKTTDIKHIV